MQFNQLFEAIPIQEEENKEENQDNQENQEKSLITKAGISNWTIMYPLVELTPNQNILVEDMLETFQETFKTSSFMIHPIKRTLLCTFREMCQFVKPEQLALYKYIGYDDELAQIDPDLYTENREKFKPEKKVILTNEIKQFLFKDLEQDDLNILFLFLEFVDLNQEKINLNMINIPMTEKLYNALIINNIIVVHDQKNLFDLNILSQIEEFQEQVENMPNLEDKQANMEQQFNLINNIFEQKRHDNV
jgi:hypothetical protein